MDNINKVLYEFNKKNYKEALIHLESIIKANPGSSENYNFKGIILQSLNLSEEARESWLKAIKLKNDNYDAYYNIANSYMSEKKYDLAKENYKKSIEINSKNFKAFFNLGRLCLITKEYHLALENFTFAKKLNDGYAPCYYNIGFVLNKLGKKNDAIVFFEKSLRIDDKYLDAIYAIGITYRELKKFNNAKKYLSRLLELNKESEYLKGAYFSVCNSLCDWKDYYKNYEEIEKDINLEKKVITPWLTLSIYDSPNIQKKTAAVFNQDLKKNNLPLLENKDSKINIGYFSANFCEHAVSNQISEMIEMHDKKKFNLYGFYFGHRQDNKLEKIKDSFDKFIDISTLSKNEILKTTKDLNIQIAVDLMGYTNGNRFEIFKDRCAPIQISYLGYAGTTGLSNMDYLIADQITIPDMYRKFFSEKIIYMPDSFMVNNSKQKISSSTNENLLGIPKNSMVYGCFNKHYKITPSIFKLWMNILKNVENSVLWLNSAEPETRNNIWNESEKLGIKKKRIIFTDRSEKYEDYLCKHKFIDLFLDTFPFSAHSTGSACLWAEVPLLTKIGRTFASNVAASLLSSLDLKELIAKNDKEYLEMAINLGKNKKLVNNLKKKIKINKANKNLFNTQLFTLNLEKAYNKIISNKIKKFENTDIYIN